MLLFLFLTLNIIDTFFLEFFIVDFVQLNVSCTSWKVSEYGVFSGQYSV